MPGLKCLTMAPSKPMCLQGRCLEGSIDNRPSLLCLLLDPPPQLPRGVGTASQLTTVSQKRSFGTHRDKLRAQKALPYAMVKGGAVLTSHLTRQLVGIMDALTLKTDQVDKLESDIAGLHHDKHIITQAFDKLSEELRTQNNELLQRSV